MLISFSITFPEIDLQVSFEQLVKVIEAKKDSAPGPDGLPCRAWASSPSASSTFFRIAFINGLMRVFSPPIKFFVLVGSP